jgi:hypothetical protein
MANNVLFLPTSTRGSVARISGCDLARADPLSPIEPGLVNGCLILEEWTTTIIMGGYIPCIWDEDEAIHTIRWICGGVVISVRNHRQPSGSPLPRRRPTASGKRSEAPCPSPRNPTQAPTRINSGGRIPARFHPLPFLSSFDDF